MQVRLGEPVIAVENGEEMAAIITRVHSETCVNVVAFRDSWGENEEVKRMTSLVLNDTDSSVYFKFRGD